MQAINFLVPGDIRTLTGGYVYDRALVAALEARGIHVSVKQSSVATIERMHDGALVVIDGLGLADLDEALNVHAQRLQFIALVHHPAGLETGLPESIAAEISTQELSALHAAQSIICTSKWTADQLTHSGLPAQRIHVIEPGVDATIAKLRSKVLRRDAALAHSEGLRMLCVATITPRKGHEILVAALDELQQFNWELDCIGSRLRDNKHAAAIENQIACHGLEKRIRFCGEVSRAALAQAYACADLFVLASHFEGFGMVFAEAHAAGLPIVATSGGATEQTLANCSGSVVVSNESHQPLRHALQNLLEHREAWLELTAAANSQSDRIRDWNHVASEFVVAVDAGSSS